MYNESIERIVMVMLPKNGAEIALGLAKSLGDGNKMHVFFLGKSTNWQKIVS